MSTGSSSSSPNPRSRGRAVTLRPARRWVWWLLGGFLVVAVAFTGTALLRGRGAPLTGVQTFPNPESGHREGQIAYPQTPPAGGPHNAVWQNCGIYDQPIRSENAVHSMEHGAVWVTYRPDLSAEEVESLRAQVRGRRYALLSPYQGLPAPVVASAWGVQLQFEGPNDPRLASFLTTYMQGPQTPEPGASCFSGTGIPTDI